MNYARLTQINHRTLKLLRVCIAGFFISGYIAFYSRCKRASARVIRATVPPPADSCYITLLHTHMCYKHDPDEISNMQSHNMFTQSGNYCSQISFRANCRVIFSISDAVFLLNRRFEVCFLFLGGGFRPRGRRLQSVGAELPPVLPLPLGFSPAEGAAVLPADRPHGAGAGRNRRAGREHEDPVLPGHLRPPGAAAERERLRRVR